MRAFEQVLAFLFFVSFTLSSPELTAQDLEKTFDELLQSKYKEDAPGVSALVFEKGKVLYRKAFGMANLELKAPMKPENVYEIGSITKQFTAVSILMLMEQDKLSLDDEITKFIPDYPTNGKKITVHHLLNHTSGIRSFTSMGNLSDFNKKDRSPTEIIDYFKDEPIDFDPGEEFRYNNSGYIILGYIIEKVSGQSYADFITEHIFKPLGMKNSQCGSHTKLIPFRASGYSPSAGGYRNADFSSLTVPYAAGSIMSCVDDMLEWHKAVRDNNLITSESKAQAFTNTTLNNGKPTNYGYGWMIGDIQDTPSIEHGGGISGYTASGIYVPSEDVYVIVLTNRDGQSPRRSAAKIAAYVLGKSYPTMEDIVTLSDEQLAKWTGNYELEDGQLRTISTADGKLFNQGDGRGKKELFPLSEDQYFSEDGFASYHFVMEKGKKTSYFRMRSFKAKGVETDKKASHEKEVIEINPEKLLDYVGQYEFRPQFIITVTAKDGQLFTQATGQPQVAIFPEEEDTFFLKVVAAQLVFSRDETGKVTSMTLHQRGREMKGNRKE